MPLLFNDELLFDQPQAQNEEARQQQELGPIVKSYNQDQMQVCGIFQNPLAFIQHYDSETFQSNQSQRQSLQERQQ